MLNDWLGKNPNASEGDIMKAFPMIKDKETLNSALGYVHGLSQGNSPRRLRTTFPELFGDTQLNQSQIRLQKHLDTHGQEAAESLNAKAHQQALDNARSQLEKGQITPDQYKQQEQSFWNNVFSNKKNAAPIVQQAQTDPGTQDQLAWEAAKLHPEIAPQIQSDLLAEHSKGDRDTYRDDIESARAGIEKGELEYTPNGQIVKKLGGLTSFVKAVKDNLTAKKEHELNQNSTDAQIIKRYFDEKAAYNPYKPVEVSEGVGQAAGGLVPMTAKSAALGAISFLQPETAAARFIGGAVMSGMMGREAYETTHPISQKENFWKFYNSGKYTAEEALAKAKENANFDAATDAATNMAMGAVGARVGNVDLSGIKFSPTTMGVIKGISESAGKILESKSAEAATMGVIGSAAQAAKNIHSGEDPSKDVLSSGAMAAAIPFVIGLGAHVGKGVTQTAWRAIKGDLAKLPPKTVSAVVDDHVAAGHMTEQQGATIKQDIADQAELEKRIPTDIEDEEARDKLRGRLARKDQLQQQLDTYDKAYHPAIKEKMAKVDEEINQITTEARKTGPRTKTQENGTEKDQDQKTAITEPGGTSEKVGSGETDIKQEPGATKTDNGTEQKTPSGVTVKEGDKNLQDETGTKQASGTGEDKVNSEKVRYNGTDAIGLRGRAQSETDAARKAAKDKISNPETNASLKAANSYTASVGLPEVEQHPTEKSTAEKQKPIADIYPKLQDVNSPDYKEADTERGIYEDYKKKFPKVIEDHDIKDYKDLVHKAYGQLIDEVQKQYDALPVKVDFHPGDKNYENSSEMLDDVHNHNHLWVYQGGDDHTELGSKTRDENGLTANDKFRAVHDFFGHSIEGYQFGKHGEENAWIEHSKMFSPLAQWALSSETRGQNSTVNYSGVNEVPLEKIKTGSALKAKGQKEGNQEMIKEGQGLIDEGNKDFSYAEQKAMVLPPGMTDVSKFQKKPITETPEKLKRNEQATTRKRTALPTTEKQTEPPVGGDKPSSTSGVDREKEVRKEKVSKLGSTREEITQARHSDTPLDDDGKVSPPLGEKLDKGGIKDAKKLRDEVWKSKPPTKVISSDAPRAAKTAEIVADGEVPTESNKALRTWDAGDFSGGDEKEWTKAQKYLVENPDAKEYKGKKVGESFNEYRNRFIPEMERIEKDEPGAMVINHNSGIKVWDAYKENGRVWNGDADKSFLKADTPEPAKIVAKDDKRVLDEKKWEDDVKSAKSIRDDARSMTLEEFKKAHPGTSGMKYNQYRAGMSLKKVGEKGEGEKRTTPSSISDPKKTLDAIASEHENDPLIQRAVNFLRPIIEKMPNVKIEDADLGGHILGLAHPDGRIQVDFSAHADTEAAHRTVIHELMHAATRGELESNKAFRAEADKILEEVRKKLQLPKGNIGDVLIPSLVGNGIIPADKYGASNAHELIAEVFSNQRFRDMLSEMKAPDEKRNMLQKVFDAIVGALNKSYGALTGLKEKISASDMGDYLMQLVEGTVDKPRGADGKPLASLSGLTPEEQDAVDAIKKAPDHMSDGALVDVLSKYLGIDKARLYDLIDTHRQLTPEVEAWQRMQDIAKKSKELGNRIKAAADLSPEEKEIVNKNYSEPLRPLATAVQAAKNVGQTIFTAWENRPNWKGLDPAIGEFSYAKNINDKHVMDMVKQVIKLVPDKLKREAISNWIEADGDTDLLKQRADALNPDKAKYKPGYVLAQHLDGVELEVAQTVKEYFDSMAKLGFDNGILGSQVENYVSHMGVNKDAPAANALLNDIKSGKLNTSFRYAKQRLFETFFDLENAGYSAKTKDIAQILGVYSQDFSKANASRAFIKNATKGTATDGRPLIVQAGIGRLVQPDEFGVNGKPSSAMMVDPFAKPEKFSDYKPINHFAMRDWYWATKDAEGNPVYAKGDLLVHPEEAKRLENILGKSALRDNAITKTLVTASRAAKSVIFSLSPFFHYVQEGTHAVGHGTNPFFGLVEPNFNDPVHAGLIKHGLQLYDYSAQSEFTEGLSGQNFFKNLPIYKQTILPIQEYLFNSYIPKLKITTGVKALERNLARNADDIKSGKISQDAVYRQTAEQMNAAFGGLNYDFMGRNKTMQDIFRTIAIAPDFLEARARFVGQSMTKFGTEQLRALATLAATQYAAARIGNYLASGDPKWTDKDHIFSVAYNGRDYTLRSVPEDIYNLISDPQRFMYNRLSPNAQVLFEGAQKYDPIRQRKVTYTEVMKDAITGFTPAGTRELLPDSWNKFPNKTGEEKLWDQFTGTIGIRSKQDYTQTQRDIISSFYDRFPKGIPSKDAQIEAKAYHLYEKGNTDEADKLIEKLSPKQQTSILRNIKKGADYYQSMFQRLPKEDKIRIYNKMTDEEKEKFDPYNKTEKLIEADQDEQ